MCDKTRQGRAWAAMAEGKFIVFEGGEACGKSTQAAILAESLGAVLTREPGGTPIGASIRAQVLDPASGDIDPRAEALLMLADRAQHVAKLVRPTLASGRHVVSDRFSGSTLAYQGHARGLGIDQMDRLSDWAAAGLVPDLVILLQVPVSEARTRLGASQDRLEAESDSFHAAVAEGFIRQAEADPGRWVLVDGTGPVESISGEVREAVRKLLGI